MTRRVRGLGPTEESSRQVEKKGWRASMFVRPHVAVILETEQMPTSFQPMPLRKKNRAFNHPDWLFELKYDGFRALAPIRAGRCQLISRNGNPFASYSGLTQAIVESLQDANDAVLDGEIVCLDKRGHPQFHDLLFHRGHACFFAFDLLWNGKDRRRDALADRKQELRRLLARVPASSPLKFVDHVDGSGIPLFERVCKLDLEGIVAKHKDAPYVIEREHSTWFKIRNPNYSQMVGREKLIERERGSEPVAGWHSCAVACEELGADSRQ
jgi:bifunctional non-homologous end joining protein LigD